MATPEQLTENPKVKLLVKSENATREDGYLPMELPYETVKNLFAGKKRRLYKLDSKDRNYKIINGDLIKQSTRS